MESEKKAFWLNLGVFAGGALLVLVGGIVGMSALGWILLLLGVAALAAVLVLRFSFFKNLYVTRRLWTLIGVGAALVLVVLGLILMFTGNANTQPSAAMPAGNTPPQMATEMPLATVTEVPATATVEVTSAPTSAPVATTVSSIFVCLNENTQVGYNIRVAPSKDAAFGGLLNWGACFNVDGKAAGYPGWYHFAKGQKGTIGVTIDVNEETYQLWVDGYYLESFGNDLEALPEIAVISK